MSFQKGHKKFGGNKKGSKWLFSQKEFRKAYDADAKKHKTNIFQFFFQEARRDGGPVLIALMKKILPDMRQVEVVKEYEDGYAAMTPAQACAAMDKATVGKKKTKKKVSKKKTKPKKKKK